MKSMKIKVSNIDETEYVYTTRSLKIKFGEKTIESPLRALTNSELIAKSNIPSEIPLQGEIAFIMRKLDKKEIIEFMDNNRKFSRVLEYIEGYKLRMQHSDIVFSLIQPTRSALRLINRDEARVSQFIRMNIKAQQMAGFESITIPWVGVGMRKAIEIYKSIERNLENELIFFVDVSDPEGLGEIVDYFKELNETGRINFVGVIYGSPRKNWPSYDILWRNLRDVDLAVIVADVERYENSRYLSGLHLQEFIFGDIFALEMKRVYKGRSKDGEEKDVGRLLKFFNRENLQVLPIKDTGFDVMENVAKEFGDDKKIKIALENYEEARRDDEKLSVLLSISKVHEFMASRDEFDVSREYIDKSETKDYIKEKETLNEFLRRIKGQKKLSVQI
ncbi:MAG: hypothetical protein H0Z28_08295 [Archaeoglobus sp.]|nr:hypothetical protein [Archaeoglobus sp.]